MTQITLSREQFLLRYRECGGQKPAWYVKYILRGFTNMVDIFINKEGVFFGKRDYDLVIAHEEGHIQGKEHTLVGLLSAYGLIRLLTV
jgi:hypothetical protein